MSTQVLTGSFINAAGTSKFIPIEGQISEFTLKNFTLSGITAGGIAGSLTSDRIVEAFYSDYMSAGAALIKQNGTVASSLAPLQNGALSTGGFTVFNANNQQNGPNVSGASFVPGQPTVFTAASHGFQVGDNVRIYGLTTAPELGGLLMTVTAVTTNTFTTLLDSTNSLTSTFTVYKVGNVNLPLRSLYYPQFRAIAKITKASPMVVTTLVQQNYQVGDVVRFAIPSVFGMTQLNTGTNGLPLEFTVVAVNNAVGTQTVSLNVDSTNFTTFAWPLAAKYPFSLPEMIPQGEGNTNNLQAFNVSPSPLPYGNQDILGFATQNQAQNGILIGGLTGGGSVTGGSIIGTTVDFWQWECVSSLQEFPPA